MSERSYDAASGPYRYFSTKERFVAYCDSFGSVDDDGQGHRGYSTLHWDGPGWYGQEVAHDRFNERYVVMVPVKDLERTLRNQLEHTTIMLNEISALASFDSGPPPRPPRPTSRPRPSGSR